MNHIICISSDSEEEEVLKKDTMKINTSVQQKQKINYLQKRKLSPQIQKENNPKKCKIIESKKKVANIKNSNEFYSNPPTEEYLKNKQLSNVNCLRTNSINNNTSTNFSPQVKTSVERNLSQNKPLLYTENVKELINQSLSQPSTSQASCQIKKVIKPLLIVKEKVSIPEPVIDVFVKFIAICSEKRNDDTTIKILDKLQKRYDKIQPAFTNNKEFESFINDVIKHISNTDENKFYFYIQEVSNELKRLNSRSKMVQIDVKRNRNKSKTDENMVLEQENTTLSKNDLYKLKKLSKVIKKCQDKIEELETQEVDFDEEENSTYIQEDRYKRKLVELFSLYSNLIGDKSIRKEIYKRPLRLKDISSKMTNIKVLDEAIIALVNSSIKRINRLKHIKNPTAIADFMTLPDYHDILQCITNCNNQEHLELPEKRIEALALRAHQSLVQHLKKQRIGESQNYLSSYMENNEDPALANSELNSKLKQNKEEGEKKLEKVFTKYEKKNELIGNDEEQSLESADSEDEYEQNEQSTSDKQMDETKESNMSDENEKSQSKENLTERYALKDSEEIQQHTESSNFENENKQGEDNKNDKQIDKTKQTTSVERSLKNINENLEEKEQSSSRDEIGEMLSNIDSKLTHKQNEKCTNDKDKDETKQRNLSNENDKSDKKKDSVERNFEKIFKNSEVKKQLPLEDEKQKNLKSPNLKNARKEDEKCVNDKERDKIKQINSSDENEDCRKKICSVDRLHPEKKQKDSTELQSASNKINHKKQNQKNNINANNNVICEETELLASEMNKATSIESTVSNKACVVNNISANKTNSSLAEQDKIIEILSDDDENVSNDKNNYNNTVIDRTSMKSESTNVNRPAIQKISQMKRIKPISTTMNKVVKDSAEILEIINGKLQTSSKRAIASKTLEKTLDSHKEKKCIGQGSPYVIKVRSFAKPPDSWKDSSSPEKVEQHLALPGQETVEDLSKPGFIDLTTEPNYRLPSTSMPMSNPLAINNCRVKNSVLLKKIISNYKVPLHKSDVKGPKIATLKNVCFVNPKNGQTLAYVPKTNILLNNNVPANNVNHVIPNTLPTNTVINPLYPLRLQKNNT